MVPRSKLQSSFKYFIFLSMFILVIEVGGSIFTNSLALLSDAGHVIVDLSALLLAYFSIRLSKRKPTKKFTFGYYRMEIFTAIINGIAIIAITIYIFYESYLRFLAPETVKVREMILIAAIGFMSNLYVVRNVRTYKNQNLNVRGAYLHVLNDTLSSLGVVIAGLLMIFTGNYIFDAGISVMIGVFILISSFKLIRDSAHILMEAVPSHIELEKLSYDIKSIKNVDEVHDLHVWSIASDVYALSAHVLIKAKNIKSMNRIVSTINRMLKSKYNITHTVIQSECENCVVNGSKH